MKYLRPANGSTNATSIENEDGAEESIILSVSEKITFHKNNCKICLQIHDCYTPLLIYNYQPVRDETLKDRQKVARDVTPEPENSPNL